MTNFPELQSVETINSPQFVVLKTLPQAHLPLRLTGPRPDTIHQLAVDRPSMIQSRNSKISPVIDQIFTANVGGMLFLKACSFVQEQHARILDVEENLLKVRVGYTWFERLLFKCGEGYPAIVTLKISGPITEEVREQQGDRLPAVNCSQIDIKISPQSSRWNEEDFRQFCRKLLWGMRHHFISP